MSAKKTFSTGHIARLVFCETIINQFHNQFQLALGAISKEYQNDSIQPTHKTIIKVTFKGDKVIYFKKSVADIKCSVSKIK